MRGTTADKKLREQLSKQMRGALRQVRRNAKLTQEDVAERIEVSHEVYGRMERGGFIPRIRTLIRLSKALKVSVDFLLGLDVNNGSSALAPKEDEKEHELPAETRRVLRSVRELRPEQLRLLMKAGRALIEAKGKRLKRRAALER